MSPLRNRKIVLAARPVGEPRTSDFELVEEELPAPGAGRALLRTLYLSLDPYMRGRMRVGKSYAPPLEIGEVMVGGTVSEVLQSSVAGLSPGDIVEGQTGWQAYAISDGGGLRKVDPALGPVSTALGVLGMPGMTAYTGLLNLGQPRPGETVVVAAASGAVGSVVGQIAKIKGCRAVGIAGGQRKCEHVVNELGLDACVDHHRPDLAERLKDACPAGIDVYFENVGGAVFDAVLPLLNPFARVPVCGLIAHYNDAAPPPGPDRLPGLMQLVLMNRLTLRGFIVSDFAEQFPEFLRVTSRWLQEGRLRYREDIVDGLESAPEAFIGLLKGKNFGKLLVRVAS
ncbi:NADP-dependent oxidoreductase [Sorangium sp. So ce1036]|uniref:NADP-dependent oxidoreductase n=1 Tax=Sorangium sp. So ce1036 TaxID=3133328 RepID=UPI003F011706